MDTYQIEQIVAAQLEAGERLLWSGEPNAARVARQALPASLFGLPFAGFALFWMTAAFSMTTGRSHAPGPWAFFPLFGLPFFLVGLGIILAPLWAYLGARRTVYALTDKRAMIIASMRSAVVRSYMHGDLGDLQHIERPDGSGDLFFATRTTVSPRGYASQSRVGFFGIPEVRNVERLLRDHLKQEAA